MIDTIILNIFNKIFSTTLKSTDVERKNYPEWDSMKHAELIIEIQKQLSIKFEIDDIIKVDNLRQLISAVARKLQA